MPWTAEAVEDLKKLALRRKERKPHLCGARRGSRNAVIGKASRIGIKLGGEGRAPCAEGPVPRAAAQNGRPAQTTRPRLDPQRSGAAAAHDPEISPGDDRVARNGLWLGRDRRDATAAVGGHSQHPPAGGRWAIRGAEILAHCALTPFEGPVLLRRPLPNGLSVVAAATAIPQERRVLAYLLAVVRWRATLRADLPLRLPKHADQTRSVGACFAPRRCGLDPGAAVSRASRAVVST